VPVSLCLSLSACLFHSVCLSFLSLSLPLCLSFFISASLSQSVSLCLFLSNTITYTHTHTQSVFVPMNHHPRYTLDRPFLYEKLSFSFSIFACLSLLASLCLSLSIGPFLSVSLKYNYKHTHRYRYTHAHTHTHRYTQINTTHPHNLRPRIISTFKTQLLESVCLSVSLCVSLCLSFLSFSFCLLLSNKITYIHSHTHRVIVPLNHPPK
jgi:hypothetical protein